MKRPASLFRILGNLKKDLISGGLADNKPDSAFDPKMLEMGIKVEMEHTKDPNIAKEIAKNHLTEDKNYYIKLTEMEKAKKDNDMLDLTHDEIISNATHRWDR